MNKRDLKKDLEILESITRNTSEIEDMVYEIVTPHALRRAIAAEEEVERLQAQLQEALSSLEEIGTMCVFEQTRQTLRISAVVGSALRRIQEGKE